MIKTNLTHPYEYNFMCTLCHLQILQMWVYHYEKSDGINSRATGEIAFGHHVPGKVYKLSDVKE